MSSTYADVDGSDDPTGAVAWQDRMATWPAVRSYKERTHALLAGAGAVLDVGCGTGVDLRPGWVGLDPSARMAGTATSSGATVVRGDAHRLPFRDGSFGGVRADRVVQHLAEPLAAIGEMGRVLRARGGRLVVSDPDQATLVIEVPGVRRRVLDRLQALRRDIGYRNGTLVSALPGHLVGVGFVDVAVERFPLVLRDPVDAFGLPGWPELWRDEGAFTDEELDEWRGAIAEPGDGFRYTVDIVVVSATRG